MPRLVAFKHPVWSGKIVFDEHASVFVRIDGTMGDVVRGRVVHPGSFGWEVTRQRYQCFGERGLDHPFPPWVRV